MFFQSQLLKASLVAVAFLESAEAVSTSGGDKNSYPNIALAM